MARILARRALAQRESGQDRQRADDILSLLALGYGFQVRLTGQVVAAHADRLDQGRHIGPVLTAALDGRLKPVTEQWLGIDPKQVMVSLHRGPGWGSVELTGRGEQRRLRVSLPAGWLARVWAAGLALAGRHLVVAVQRAGWPDARVLALRAPGTEPVPLDVRASVGQHSDGQPGDGQPGDGQPGDGQPGAPDAPHWEI
jgi:anti-sigma factor RsiW